MTQAGAHELVVGSHSQLADRAPTSTGPAAEPEEPVHGLGWELRQSKDWQRTTRDPSASWDGVDLSGEDLRGVDFSGASLVDANFTNANLANAHFAWTNLSHANFEGAVGLVGAQFARAELTGATLPPNVKFGAFDTANEIAEGTAKLLLTLLLVCAYSWLTINSTLDAKLLTDTGASQLPILNAQIPIVNFYALVPLALVGLALVMMLQSQRLWATVAAAPAALPDGTSMADRAGAWILGPWAVARLIPARRRGFLTELQARLAALVGWWLVPATVVWFWARYLHRHDWPVTVIQLVAITVGFTASVGFLQLAHATLPETHGAGGARRSWKWLPARRHPYWPTMAVGLGVPLLFTAISYVGIHGIQSADDVGSTGQGANERPALTLRHAVPALQGALPDLLARVGLHPVAQLEDADVSTRLAATSNGDTSAEAKASGARLVGADLRFASAERVFLPLSNLRRADMLGADLWSADLRGSNLTGASLVGALLYDADIRRVRAKAILAAARRDSGTAGVLYADSLFCNRTSFAEANMRYARLNGGDFREASFDGALLQGVTFLRARLTHATFIGADLDGADFRGSSGLAADQILGARHVDALFDSTLLNALKVRSPSRFAAYDAGAVAIDAERQRLSGEDEPDVLTADEARTRDSVVRAAYEGGPSATPSASDKSDWVERGRVRPGSTDHVPHGCVMERTIHQRR